MEKHTSKDIRRNSAKENETTQPQPLSGSHKVKNQKHSRQKQHSHHDL